MNLEQKGWACCLFANIHWAIGGPNSGGITFSWFVLGALIFVAHAVTEIWAHERKYKK